MNLITVHTPRRAVTCSINYELAKLMAYSMLCPDRCRINEIATNVQITYMPRIYNCFILHGLYNYDDSCA